MKNNSVIKVFLTSSIAAFVATACGSDKVKDKDKIFKVSLTSNLASIAPEQFIIKGIYKSCYGKTDNSEWNLSLDVAQSDAFVRKGDKKCILQIKEISAGAEVYTYTKVDTNYLSLNEDSYKKFINLKDSSRYIFVKAKINTLDYSELPIINVLFSNFLNSNLVKTSFGKLEFYDVTLSFGHTESAKFSVDESEFKPEVDDQGNRHFLGSLHFKNTADAQKKASMYFVVEESDGLDLSDINVLNRYVEVHKDNPNIIFPITSDNGDFTLNASVFNRQGGGTAILKGVPFKTHIVIVRTEQIFGKSENSFSIIDFTATRDWD
ncbi:hypothetical protein [Fluviispira multicolorata]|uniref:Uncharacterized protein n=1 Tax=Fluviispira multicolorata TaxID=2654512 RepID=A0A833N453_9BACT|nr:hypothetical protein [Fluviispira multicolorata]KAB8031054.1 hypothetical protein GCL57_08795 [Fluviispira multicolorata]